MRKANRRTSAQTSGASAPRTRLSPNGKGLEALSLSALATSLLDLVLQSPGGVFTLDHASKALKAPRRRLYDVLNVWEGLCIVERLERKSGWLWVGRAGFEGLCQRVLRANPLVPIDFLFTESSLAYDSAMRRSAVAVTYFMIHPQRAPVPSTWSRRQFLEIFLEAAEHARITEPRRRVYDVLNLLEALCIVSPTTPGNTTVSHTRFAWTPLRMNPGMPLTLYHVFIESGFVEGPDLCIQDAEDAEGMDVKPIAIDWEVPDVKQGSIMMLMADWNEDTCSSLSASFGAVADPVQFVL